MGRRCVNSPPRGTGTSTPGARGRLVPQVAPDSKGEARMPATYDTISPEEIQALRETALGAQVGSERLLPNDSVVRGTLGKLSSSLVELADLAEDVKKGEHSCRR